jgi:predicted Zn finger-like uncharacterized protein
MSRLTRCPACATVFRVTEAQLASRQGFVRCGQCAKVFDARASLLMEAPAPPEEQEPASPEPQGPAYVEEQEPAYPEDTRASAPHEPESETVAAAQGAAAVPDSADSSREHADAPPATALDGTASEPLSAPEPEYSLAESEPVPAAFEFGPRHRARSRLAMALWGLGGALAMAALAGQAVYWFRTDLALAMPGTRPHLEAACRALGCVIPPPRQIGLLSIESSELQVDRNVPGLLTLNATLRNRATFAQAHPSIEVTLTDAAERPLARRVLAPADYLGDRLAREPLFAAASEHAVQLHVDATAYRPTGYRLFLFHP